MELDLAVRFDTGSPCTACNDREARLVMAEAVDRVRAKFGPDTIGPAGAVLRAS
ncbi:hypothetical protein ACFWP7_40825 [Streptomyces sp. NPDC058470]|uniref:hypothetical protein n=1 Tax=Streptomyces sp. NPDC058470 TaxID=3346515 RepID=UPI00364AD066